MKCLFAVSVLMLSASVIAQSAAPAPTAAKRPDPQMRDRMMAKVGGFIEKPGSQKGRILILDAQSVVPSADLSTAVTHIADIARFRFDYEHTDSVSITDGNWAKLLAEKKATVLVCIVADDKTPSILVSPDECWAVLNVKRLAADKASAALCSQRTVKQLYRALALVSGSTSRFKTPLGGAFSVADLDNRPDMLPMDQIQQIADYVYAHGMRNTLRTTYRRACQEGWAPAPTNDVQKAIWDKVHQLPTKPIKILPETKPVKE